MYKIASYSNKDEARNVLKQIYDENPKYWPYGLNIEGMHDLYLVKDSSSNETAGFVGWQELKKKNKDNRLQKVGSYVIGILPKYRNCGFAKEAVSKIISMKSASVDRVEAAIVETNEPSLALAKALDIKHIDMWKAASSYNLPQETFADVIPRTLPVVGGMLGSAYGAFGGDDYKYDRDAKGHSRKRKKKWDDRAIDAALYGVGGMATGALPLLYKHLFGRLSGNTFAQQMQKDHGAKDDLSEYIPKPDLKIEGSQFDNPRFSGTGSFTGIPSAFSNAETPFANQKYSKGVSDESMEAFKKYIPEKLPIEEASDDSE